MDGTGDTRSPAPVPLARWFVAMQEPLIGARRHLELEDDARQWSIRNPQVASAWFAGTVWQIAATLPKDDPWRQIAVNWPQVSGETLVKGDTEGVPWRGAYLKGEAFGQLAHGRDIVFASGPDPTLDAGLVALTGGITPAAAAVVGLSFGSWEAPHALLSSFGSQEGSLSQIFDEGAAALRWVMWRRRAYVGQSDPYPRVTALAWVGRAERVASGLPIDIGGCQFEIDSEAQRDGDWSDLSQMLGDDRFFPHV